MIGPEVCYNSVVFFQASPLNVCCQLLSCLLTGDKKGVGATISPIGSHFGPHSAVRNQPGEPWMNQV